MEGGLKPWLDKRFSAAMLGDCGDDVACDRKQSVEMFGGNMRNVSTTPTNEKGRWITLQHQAFGSIFCEKKCRRSPVAGVSIGKDIHHSDILYQR